MVFQILGSTFSEAIGMMISPLPIIAMILVLMGPNPKVKGIAYTAGWVAATLLMIYVAIHLGSGTTSKAPTMTNGITQMVIGVFFFLFGLKQLQTSMRTRHNPTLPNWMNGVADLGPGKALGLSFLLAITNVKNIPLAAQAVNKVIPLGPISRPNQVIGAVLFSLVTALPLIVPTVYVMRGGSSVHHTLERMKEFLTKYNHLIMGVLFVMMGAQSIGGATQIIVAN